jgi:putative spermidine/putrescine transport system substrate-binding protein
VRRPLLVAAATLALSALAAGCGGSSSSSSSTSGGGSAAGSAKSSANVTLTAYVDGDVNVKQLYDDTLIPGFEKANPGIKIHMIFSEHGNSNTATLARIVAAAKQNRYSGFDFVDSGITTTLATVGALQKATTSAIPNLDKVDPKLLKPVQGNAIPYRGSSVVLAYNSSHVSSPPQTLDQLVAWIKAHPGKFTYNSPNTGGSGGSFVETVVDRYVPQTVEQKMVNSYVPNDEKYWKKGLSVLQSLNPDVYQHTYPNGNQPVLDLLSKGDLWVAPVWSDQALSEQAAGQLPTSIKLTQISNPPFNGGAAYVGVTKTSKNPQAVDKFVDYILTPAVQAKIVKKMSGYPAINVKYLNSNVKQKFKDVQANTLREGYSTKMTNDLNAQWQQTVP